MNRFTGKTVLVTGGNSGIGLGTALAFSKEGARLVITGRDQTTLDKAKTQLGANTIAVRNDAGSVSGGTTLAETLKQSKVTLDALFLNAGVAKLAPLEAVNEQQWDDIFNTNIKGPYFLIQALVGLINPGGAIVLNGSINAHIGMPNSSVYAASKAAIISLAKTLSAELLPRGVRVNVVSPGPVTTPLYGKLGFDAATLETVAAQIQSQIPLGRFGKPEEIGRPCCICLPRSPVSSSARKSSPTAV